MGVATARVGVAFTLYATLLTATLGTAYAQPSSVQPGVIERGEEKPAKPKSSPDLVIPEVTTPAPDGSFDTIKLTLRDVVIEGNAAIDSETLKAQFASLIGHEVSLSQVFSATQAITKLYVDRGYALCLAYIPAQDIENGVVKIRVVEGYIESIDVTTDDAQLARIVSGYGDNIKASRPLKTAVLERYLLLANDLPGVRVRSVVDKGSGAPGAMKMILRVEHRQWEPSLSFDNRGTKALGPERGRIDLVVNGLLSARDRLSVTYMRGVDDDELDYFAGSFSLALNSEGSVLSFEGSNTNSQPGTNDLSAIEFETRGLVVSARLFHPFIRSRAQNLSAEFGLTFKDLQGDILGLPNSDDRLSVLSLTSHYDLLDAWNGISAFDLILSQGVDALDATDATNPFPSRIGADSEFTRLELSVSRVQHLTDNLEFYVAASGQYADSALLSSEQCGYGGTRYGRAFDSFEISGDHCAMAQVEFRYQLTPFVDALDYLQLYTFADAGWVHRRGLILPGEFQNEDAQSAGAGVRFGMFEHMDASVEYTDPLGTPVSLENSDDGRVFFSLTLHR
jgi:hemolysin activation/secretion protein